MVQPPFLQKGNTVGITAPGRKLNADVLSHAIKTIESFGLKVIVGGNILSSQHSYLAGSDKERLDDLQAMLNNPDVHCIICARGGYGTTRILDQLNFESFLKTPKWICGFSDVTALHLKLNQLGVQSIHSTMPILFPKEETKNSIESLITILFGGKSTLEAEENSSNKIGSASGQLVGGNLSLIVDSLGTSSEIDTQNKILVIEEVDEFIYKIDRMLVQLKRAGKLSDLAGLAVGQFSDTKETDLPFGETIEQIILHHVKEFTFPVGFNFPTGHQNPNLAWVQGKAATLAVNKTKALLTS